MDDKTITNDLTIMVATVNGSGSQSSNLILSRSLFAMGIPVGPKNLFPSNIQGLPTWFSVRANAQGYVAQKDEVDVMVCLNAATWADDVARVHDGGVVIYEASYPESVLERAGDVIAHPVPFNALAKEHIKVTKLRKLLTNLIYVGVLAELLGIDPEVVRGQIAAFFSRKPKAVPLNVEAFEVGLNWARENITKQDPYRVETIPGGNKGKILIEGNNAAALGAVFGGVTVMPWYPITPSSSLCESAISYMHRLRIDEDGKRKFCAIQAEDELAAVGMVIGAGWAGARALTATSGPGVSLMSEFAGLAYYAEIPAVVWNIQRGGPSTGLPTRTQQADVQSTARLSHGDTCHVCLIPSTPAECFEFGQTSLDLAERLQTIVFVLSDLDLGMNTWASDPFEYPGTPYDRGKVLDAEELKKVEDWGRYKDVDGDAVGWRTLPGTEHAGAAYFTRGTGHDEYARYTEDNHTYKSNLERLRRKYDETAPKLVPQPEIKAGEYGEASVGIIAYGTSDQAMKEARDYLAQDGIPTDYLRIRAIPFPASIREFIESHEHVFLVEQNRDAQMKAVYCEENPDLATSIESILHFDGMSIDARFIVDHITNALAEKKESVVHG